MVGGRGVGGRGRGKWWAMTTRSSGQASGASGAMSGRGRPQCKLRKGKTTPGATVHMSNTTCRGAC